MSRQTELFKSAEVRTERVKRDKPRPALVHYLAMRARATEKAGAGSLLAYQMGDFYEFFYDDAEAVGAVIDLAVTRRGTFRGEPIAFAGFPKHSAGRYFEELTKAGHTVVVCDEVKPGARYFQPSTERVLSIILTPEAAA